MKNVAYAQKDPGSQYSDKSWGSGIAGAFDCIYGYEFCSWDNIFEWNLSEMEAEARRAVPKGRQSYEVTFFSDL